MGCPYPVCMHCCAHSEKRKMNSFAPFLDCINNVDDNESEDGKDRNHAVVRFEEESHHSDLTNHKDCVGSKPLGVSVHHLTTTFLDEIKSYVGYDNKQDSSLSKAIHELENLNEETGFTRQKGANMICPEDGKKGTSYVNALQGEDNVGPATHMLSYTWAYKPKDIAEALDQFCQKNQLDPKRVYVWICCLCINQHRVYEDRKSGKMVPFDEFKCIFEGRVKSINKLIAVFSPWSEPRYLTRVWCIFEIFTANKIGCEVSIEMPEEQLDDFRNYVFYGKNHLEVAHGIFKVLGKTKIEEANASVEEDRINILSIVNNSIGTSALNCKVNCLMRSWVNGNLNRVIKELDEMCEIMSRKNDNNALKIKMSAEEIAQAYYNIGAVFYSNRQWDDVYECFSKQLKLCESEFGEDHVITSNAYSAMGGTYHAKGDLDTAIEKHMKAIRIREKHLGLQHIDTSESYYNIGMVYEAKEDYKTTLHYYKKSLAIREKKLGKNHERTAETYNAVGSVHHKMGHLNRAMRFYQRSTRIKEQLVRNGNEGIQPNLAATYKAIGQLFGEKGALKQKMEFYSKALKINEKVLGGENSKTSTLRQSMITMKQRFTSEFFRSTKSEMD